jgi:hypothetical protein
MLIRVMLKFLMCRIVIYEGGSMLKVQVFIIYGLRMTSRCHLHILVRRVEEK